MTQKYRGVRVLAVHAHPDDEALWTGGYLAQLVRRGADVTVITCTLGEQGEVIGEPFRNLVVDHADQLGGFRIRELQRSLHILGVRGQFLGGAGCWRDSGMAGTPAAAHPRALVNNLAAATEQLRLLIAVHRPHLIITYGPDGGYGHPDHIAAHRITHAAAPADARIVWAVTSCPDLERGLRGIHAIPTGWRRAKPGELSCVDPSGAVRIVLDEQDVEAKRRAMKAHATQLWFADGSTSDTNPMPAVAQADTPVFALSNLIAQPLLGCEFYQWGAGSRWPTGAIDCLDGITWN